MIHITICIVTFYSDKIFKIIAFCHIFFAFCHKGPQINVYMGWCTELSKFSKKNVLLKKPLVAKIWRIFQIFFLHISSQNMFLNKCSTPKGQLNYNLCLLEEGKVEKLAENSVCKEQLDLTTKF